MRLLVCLGLWCAAGGCSSMDSIDRRVERLVRARSETIGAAVTPQFREPVLDSYDERGQYEKQPPSTNLSASELTYTAADPERDVLSRLKAFAEPATEAEHLDLRDILRISQRSAREYLSAEEDYLLAAIRLLIERHLWGPRFFDDVASTVDFTRDDGAWEGAYRLINTLRATQRLPYGGEVEARAVWEAAQQLRSVAGDQYTTASTLSLSANIPLLRNAGLIAQEDLIQAERDLIYAARDFERFRREFFVDIASEYFNLIAQAQSIENTRLNYQGLLRESERTLELVEAGRTPRFEVRNFEDRVLSSENDLRNAEESYRTALDRFKIRLGIPVERQIVLLPFTLDIPEPEVSVDTAGELALRYRLDLQNARDRLLDARRNVRNARNQLLPDLDAALSADFRNDIDDENEGFTIDPDDADYIASLTLGLPLDREIERLNLRSAIISLQRAIREYEEFRDSVILDARAAVRQIELARFSLTLSDERVEINLSRLEALEINRAEATALDVISAREDLLSARNNADNARRDLRIAILRYLLTTDQLRVGLDGSIEPLAGMVIPDQPGEAEPEDAGPPDPVGDDPSAPPPPA